MTRLVYLLAMYTGVRACFNQARSRFLAKPRASVLDGSTFQFGEPHRAVVRVNARTPPMQISSASAAGMISVSLVNPEVSRFVYGLFRLSSHFGCGHIELAFYEKNRAVCFYAIRNILRANAKRVGCEAVFNNLPFSRTADEVNILRNLLLELRKRGIKAYLASPDECVALAVSGTLLNPKTKDQSLRSFTGKYRRITKQMERHCKTLGNYTSP